MVLRDGSILRVRSAGGDDRAALVSLHARLAGGPEPPWLGGPLSDGDHGTLVGESGGRVWAVAHVARDPRIPSVGHVVVLIAPALQGRGAGTRLLEALADVGRAGGLEAFEARVPIDPPGTMQLLVDSGFDFEHTTTEGVALVRLSLTRTPVLEARMADRAAQAATASMHAFFAPRGVAVVGASRTGGGIGSAILANLRADGFTGRLAAVNPHAVEIDHVPCFPRVSEVSFAVDLVIVAVSADLVGAVIEDAAGAGAQAFVVISAGFGETGDDGQARERALVERVRASGARLIGPNCMGLLNTDPSVRLNGTFAPVYPPAGSVGFLSQSGALGLAVLDYAARLGIGISTFVSVGNKADVSSNDLLQYWASDARTNVILLYLESFGNPANFVRIVPRVSRLKPVVAVKAGRSAAGARAAASHTGALASGDRVVDAVFRQTGVIRVETLEELFDVAVLAA